MDEQLKDYISEWRKQRAKEEEELKGLKEKQAKRKISRAEEEKRLAQKKKEEEERRQREIGKRCEICSAFWKSGREEIDGFVCLQRRRNNATWKRREDAWKSRRRNARQ